MQLFCRQNLLARIVMIMILKWSFTHKRSSEILSHLLRQLTLVEPLPKWAIASAVKQSSLLMSVWQVLLDSVETKRWQCAPDPKAKIGCASKLERIRKILLPLSKRNVQLLILRLSKVMGSIDQDGLTRSLVMVSR